MTMTTPRSVVLLGVLIAALSWGLGCGWKLETRGDASPQAGEQTDDETARPLAAAFTLSSDDGSFVSLDDLLADRRPAVLVFYRGHW
jgi:hypothetical protein